MKLTSSFPHFLLRTHSKGSFTYNTGKLKKYITFLIYDIPNLLKTCKQIQENIPEINLIYLGNKKKIIAFLRHVA